jgi:tetratricopeptide (TPR) repeat protein
MNLIVLGKKDSKNSDLTNIVLILDPATPPAANNAGPPSFFDEPHFTVAGVTDTTNLGGHGSDAIVRNRDALAKEAASLHPLTADASPNSTAEQHHQLAESDEKQGKPLEAVREFEQAAKLNPSEPNLFDWGAELLLHRTAAPAIEVFTEGSRLFPRSVRMLTALGAAWYAQGSYEKAVQSLCAASDLNPLDPEPYLFMGKIEAAETAQSDALAEKLARFGRLQPENAMANYYFAVSLWKRRPPGNAAAFVQVKSLLEKAIQLDPKSGLAYLQLGILYSEQKDLANAISAYHKAIDATPLLEQAHYRLAQAYRQAGENSRAQSELQLYEHITKVKIEENERQRHELQQFVYQLHD